MEEENESNCFCIENGEKHSEAVGKPSTIPVEEDIDTIVPTSTTGIEYQYIAIMKSRVYQSTFSFILTLLVIALLLAGCFATYGSDKFILLLVITVVLLAFSMFYAPLSVSANEKEVSVHSPFKIHSIPMRRIVKCERFHPTMGAIRVCGAGGFMGYWGIFREGDVGRYMAYYGKSSDCFIIHLDNGDKYVLGCKDPDAMVEYINTQITK